MSALQVVKFESLTERERTLSRLTLGRSPTKMPTQLIQPADDDESGLLTLSLSQANNKRKSKNQFGIYCKKLAFCKWVPPVI